MSRLEVQPRLRVGILGAGMIGIGDLPQLGKVRDRVEVTAIANRGIEKHDRPAPRPRSRWDDSR